MDSILYDSKNDQTYRFGLHILDYVPHNMKQSIIDIGSGSGALTRELSYYAGYVIGIDKCLKTVRKAQNKYPMVPFYVMDACRLQYENRFDVAFSNATFHEIEDKEKLYESVYKCLKNGGRLIAEFASKNGNREFFDALDREIETRHLGNDARVYFLINKDQCIEYLEKQGFRIEHIEENVRTTYVRGGDREVREMLSTAISTSVDKAVREEIIDNLMKAIEAKFKTPRGWVKEVCRLRVIAVKD